MRRANNATYNSYEEGLSVKYLDARTALIFIIKVADHNTYVYLF